MSEMTFEIGGAKITVATNALFQAWLQKQVGAVASPATNIPPLAEGETYLFGLVQKDGKVCHTILLPGDNEPASQEKQLAWAQSIGGDLPDRVEQAYLNANHNDLFQKEAYWSNQLHKDERGWAWSQNFSYGTQLDTPASGALRARAVRRLVI